MTDFDVSHDQLVADARRRGSEALGATIIPPGFDHVTAYIGLVANALELGKLIATEERDLTIIGHHHEREMAKIGSAFREVEAAMIADFKRDNSVREEAFKCIQALIAAGQLEVATHFYEILMNGFKRPALELILEARNAGATSSKTRMTLK